MCFKFMFELFLMIRVSGMITFTISNNFLIQDKFCRNVYNQSELFCQHINNQNLLKDEIIIRDNILSSAAKYVQLQNAVEFIPMVVWSLFVGSFLDKVKNSTKWILLLHIVAEMFQLALYTFNEFYFELSPYWMLIASAPIYFSGGLTTFLTAAYRFVVLISTERSRRIRLMVVMFSLTVGMAIGRFLGGQFLIANDLTKNHTEIRTYWLNYVASFLLDSISIALLIITMKYVKKDTDVEDEEQEENIENGETEVHVDGFDEANSSEHTSGNMFRKIFDINNVKETIACLSKPRPNHINFQIYTIYFTYFFMYFVYLGQQVVQLQFCEKVYHWTSTKFSNILSIQMIVSTTTVTGSVMFFIKTLKVNDSMLIVTTLGISAMSQFLIGSFLMEWVYFFTMPFAAAGDLALICVRNKLSTMISEVEVGRIFSLMATIEATIPLISSIAYSDMFSALISTYPGIVYHFSGVLFFITMSITIFEQYYCESF